jgi:23S rRNA (cytidine1920-2'-O)/16S rRNA (cytidine1409-2'-O)-methyltransferase
MMPMNDREKLRLDTLLAERGFAPTRSRARDLIKRGLVAVNGRIETRPGVDLTADAEIIVSEDWSGYVSRGALKLTAALDHFGFDCSGRVAFDVGASTGGFTQVLLRCGAKRVYAIDVGKGQLHADLRNDPRVISMENTDVRTFGERRLGEPVNAIVADVSFISLTKALPAVLSLALPGAWAVALVKPQFEAGREHVGKGGIVRDEAAREAALAHVVAFFNSRAGWQVIGTMASPIEGQSGNREFLLGAVYAP